MSAICSLIQLDTGFGPVRKIWADATLYYADELRRKLGLAKSIKTDDAGLILAAYEKWGEDCVEHLEGDFAFAILDPREQKLFCARDRYGMRPFYYHHSPCNCFTFASDARDVLRYPVVPFAINEGRIADFLVQELEWIDYTSTFFEGIYRLPPAHKLVVTVSGLETSEYWEPEPGPTLGLVDDDEYQEMLLEVLSRAVDERLAIPEGRVGSMLSGGMDSGSIVALGNRLLDDRGSGQLPVYSLAQPRGADCIESQRIYATLDSLGLEGTQILAEDTAELAETLVKDLAEPFDGQMLFARAIYRAARLQDVDVVLDGAAGDVVFNEGRYITRMIRQGKVLKAWREIAGERVFWQEASVVPTLLRHLRAGLIPEFMKKPFRALRHRAAARGFVDASLISREFADHIDIAGRCEQLRETFSGTTHEDPAMELVRKIRPNLTAGRERYGRMAAAAGVEARDPFTDHRLVDFCTRLPGDQMLRDSWPKYVLREAMQGYLPDTVRWGRGKPHIGGIYNRNFLEREINRGALQLDDLVKSLEDYVDAAALRVAWHEYEAGGSAEPVHSAHILTLWLAQTAKRPIVKYQGFR